MIRIGEWDAHELQLAVNPRLSQDREPLINPDVPGKTSCAFDPMSLECASGDELMFSMYDVIMNYSASSIIRISVIQHLNYPNAKSDCSVRTF